MGVVELPAGEVVEVVSEIGTNEEYFVEHVSGNAVGFDHTTSGARVDPAMKLAPYQTAELDEFRGKGVYAFAEDGAKVRVSESGFSFNIMSPRVYEAPNEAALRANNFEVVNANNTISSNFEEPLVFDFIDEDRDLIFEEITIAARDPVDAVVTVFLYDEEGDSTEWAYAPYPEGAPLDFDPGLLFPSEYTKMDVFVMQKSGSEVEFDASVIYRPRYQEG